MGRYCETASERHKLTTRWRLLTAEKQKGWTGAADGLSELYGISLPGLLSMHQDTAEANVIKTIGDLCEEIQNVVLLLINY